MSAEASVGSHAADSAVPQAACHNTDGHRSAGLLGSKYVKLNVGGSLHYTTVQTLSKEDSLLRNICTGGTDVTIDSEGPFLCLSLNYYHVSYIFKSLVVFRNNIMTRFKCSTMNN